MSSPERMRVARGAVLPLLAVVAVALPGCEKYQETPNVPASYQGRPVDIQGTVYVTSDTVSVDLWDSGLIDGDTVTLVLNDQVLVSQYTLTGTKRRFDVKLQRGYNYVLLFAHNEGSVPPNTAAVALDDGANYQMLEISATLASNGAYDIVVPR